MPPFKMSKYSEREFAQYQAQPMRITCGLCGEIFEGTAERASARSLKHRTKKHPETLIRKTRRHTRSLSSFRARDMHEDDRAEIENERQKRARLHGVTLDE